MHRKVRQVQDLNVPRDLVHAATYDLDPKKRVCGDAVLLDFWCGFAVIFIFSCGIAVLQNQAVFRIF